MATSLQPVSSQGEYPHRGITMHQMRVGGNYPGLLFAVGSVLIFLFAIPALWYLIGAALVVGIAIAGLLHLVHHFHPEEAEQLSFRL